MGPPPSLGFGRHGPGGQHTPILNGKGYGYEGEMGWEKSECASCVSRVSPPHSFFRLRNEHEAPQSVEGCSSPFADLGLPRDVGVRNLTEGSFAI